MVDNKCSAYRARVIISFSSRRATDHMRNFFASWRYFFLFRIKVRECEWSVSLANAKMQRRVDLLCSSRVRARILGALRAWQRCSLDDAHARELVLRAIGIQRKSWERERLVRSFGAMVSHVKGWRYILVLQRMKQLLRKCKFMASSQWTVLKVAEKRMSGEALKVVQRLVSRGLVEGFERWRDSVVEGRQMKAKALKVVRRLMSRGLVEGFERWRDSVVEGRRMKAKALKVVQRLMKGSLAAAFERWRDSTDEKCHSLEHASKAEILLRIVDARIRNARRLKAFGTWSQRLKELQSCNGALCLLQHQSRKLERKRALATWIRAVADAHQCTRGIYHIAAKLWHVWEIFVLTKHMCLWKQLVQMCCQSSELWGKLAFILLKNTHTSGFLRALHKLNARASSRVLHHEKESEEEPAPQKESRICKEEQATNQQTTTGETSLEQQHETSTCEWLSKSASPPHSPSPSPCRIPLAAIQVLSQAEQIWEQVANGRKKYLKEFDWARAAQAPDEKNGSPACGRAWSNQGSIAATLRDLGVDLEQPFSGHFIPLSSIYYGGSDLAAGRAAAQFPASSPRTLEALGLSKSAALRPGTREPTAASHVSTPEPAQASLLGPGTPSVEVLERRRDAPRSSCIYTLNTGTHVPTQYRADSVAQDLLFASANLSPPLSPCPFASLAIVTP